MVHTLLSNEHTVQFTSCLVVCPLNTILNWQYEWKKWLDKRDRLPVSTATVSAGGASHHLGVASSKCVTAAANCVVMMFILNMYACVFMSYAYCVLILRIYYGFTKMCLIHNHTQIFSCQL